jgi:tetratricopeptide (TPR) repeat protein
MADRMHEAGAPLSIDAGMIGRWERGERRPSAPYAGVLATVFDLPAAELGLLEETVSPSPYSTLMEAVAVMESDLERREFLRQVATAMLGSTAVGGALHPLQGEPWERLWRALQQERATVSHVEQLAESLVAYRRQYSTVASGQLLGPVLCHLQLVTQLLETSHPDRVHQQLLAVAGETAGLAGWLSFDLRDAERAQAYYKVALAATQELKDPWVHGHILGRMSFLAMYQGKHVEQVGLLEAASDHAARGSSSTLRAWLAAVAAEASACVGNEHACRAALEQADGHLDQVADLDPAADIFDRARLAGYGGVCDVRLGEPQAAVPMLETALSSLAPEFNRQRANVLVDLATAHVHQGAPERACEVAAEAVILAGQTRAAVGLQRLRQLRAELEPWRDTAAVRELDARILLV